MQPQLGVVERVSLAFLAHYLAGSAGALKRMVAAATVPGTATIRADPQVR